jgi:serine/threonine protein kinase
VRGNLKEMIEAGTVLQNRYRVEKQIGQGGMGAVFVATDERFGSRVAIKETLMLDEKFRKAFEREARLLNSLRHPALPSVSDHFVDGSGQFLVMEYIDGEDLSTLMENEGRTFPLTDVLNWADQLLDALEYLHTQEIPVIHRDIKPHNLKLNSRGQIILLDFGLAKGNSTNIESNTASKSVFGYSRNYASLEQIQGTGTDPRSDLYSLAATLYHLLTGVPPADALTRAMNVLSEKADPLVQMSVINQNIPAAISEVLHKAMALNANQRPASAHKMRAMLWESEESLPEDLQPFADKRLSANLFTQKTAVLGDASNPLQTNILADEPSKVTKAEPGLITGEFDDAKTMFVPPTEQGSRRGLAIGASLGALLLAGIAALAMYGNLFNSNNAPVTTTNAAPRVETITASESNGTVSNVNVRAEPVSNVVATSNTARVETKNEPKQTANTEAQVVKPPAKDAKNQTTVVDNSDEMDDNSDNSDDEDVPKPQTVPKPGRNTTNSENQIPPAVWKQMTPDQRRKLKLALEIQKQQREIEKRQRREQQQQRQDDTAPPK